MYIYYYTNDEPTVAKTCECDASTLQDKKAELVSKGYTYLGCIG